MKTNKVVVVIAFFVAASLGFAQGMRGTGGGGMAGQPIDGTTIKPKSIVASGNITSSTLNVGTTSTGPRASVFSEANGDAPSAFSSNDFIVGRDAASGANSGAVFLRYDSTNNQGTIGVLSPVTAWRRLRLRGADFQFINAADSVLLGIGASGNVSAFGSVNSQVASGNNAYTCTYVGCRLSLGNTGRYLTDDGTNLEFVAPVQATSFEATTTTGSALTGGGATNPLLFTSNTPDSWTNQGANGAFTFKAANNLNFGDSLVTFQDGTGATVARINDDGWFYSTAFASYNTGTQTSLYSTRADSASSVAWSVDAVSLQTEGSEIMVWRAFAPQNFWEERAAINHLGLLRVNKSNEAKPTCNAANRGRVYYLDGAAGVPDTYEVCSKNAADAYAWVQVGFSSENASAPMTLTSNTPDTVTSGTVPAIRLQASQNITDTDLLMSVEDSAGNRRLAVSENGNGTFAGNVTAGSGVITNFFNQTGYGSRGNNAITIPDNGAGTPATYTWQPQFAASVTHFTCNDANGCEITMSLGASFDGVYNRAFNVGTNTVTFKDTAGLSEMAGDFAMGQWDTIEFMVVSGRFVELNRSNN